MKFHHTDGAIPLSDGPCTPFVNIYCGPSSLLRYSASRKLLQILAPSGWADLTYEDALSLKVWLNENVE